MGWNTILPLLQQVGPAGLLVGFVVLCTVYVLEYTTVLNSPIAKRWAAVILSVLFAGVPAAGVPAALTAAIGLLASTLVHLAQEWLTAYLAADSSVSAATPSKAKGPQPKG